MGGGRWADGRVAEAAPCLPTAVAGTTPAEGWRGGGGGGDVGRAAARRQPPSNAGRSPAAEPARGCCPAWPRAWWGPAAATWRELRLGLNKGGRRTSRRSSERAGIAARRDGPAAGAGAAPALNYRVGGLGGGAGDVPDPGSAMSDWCAACGASGGPERRLLGICSCQLSPHFEAHGACSLHALPSGFSSASATQSGSSQRRRRWPSPGAAAAGPRAAGRRGAGPQRTRSPPGPTMCMRRMTATPSGSATPLVST